MEIKNGDLDKKQGSVLSEQDAEDAKSYVEELVGRVSKKVKNNELCI